MVLLVRAGEGGGEGQETSLRERKRRGTKTTGSSVRAPFGHREKWPPEPPRRLPARRQQEAACPVRRHPGTPSAARPQRSAPGQAGSGDPRALPGQLGAEGGRRNRAAPLPPVPLRCPDPRWRSGGFGKGLPPLRVSMPLCPEGTPRPETLFPHSLRSSRRWPRRRPSQGQAAGRETWRPAEPCPAPQAGRQPPAAGGAQPGPPASAAPGVGGRRKREQCDGSRRGLLLSGGLPQQPR